MTPIVTPDNRRETVGSHDQAGSFCLPDLYFIKILLLKHNFNSIWFHYLLNQFSTGH
jgi:hypothetical protein